jgi:transcriptional regulator with XRE-family HTH domain
MADAEDTTQEPRRKNPLGPTGDTVAANVQRLRKDQHLTFAALAERLSEIGRPIPPLGLRKIEKGDRRVDADDLVALAVALGVSPTSLLMPNTESVDDAVVVTGYSDHLSAGRAFAWFGGTFPISAEEPWANFIAHAWPRWYWERFEGAVTEALTEPQRVGVDDAGNPVYAPVTWGRPPGASAQEDVDGDD